MLEARVTIEGMTPYSQSRPIQTKKQRDETSDEHEERCWRERCHVNRDGDVYIPPMCFKNCLSEAAKYKSIQIPGKGKATYTKHFEAGVLVVEPLTLPVKLDDVQSERLFVPADGRRGGSKRVWKHFPVFHEWGGTVQFMILDEIINEEVFEMHVRDAGQFIGVGRFRPRNNGYYGRFDVKSVEYAKA